MTAYHATHESPFDDACPDCAGYPEYAEPRNPRAGLAICAASALLVVALVVIGIRRFA